MTASLHELADLQKTPTAALFEGAKHGGGMAVSFFVTAHPPGEGPDLHFHPYAEAFLVQEGEATFTAGDDEVARARSWWCRRRRRTGSRTPGRARSGS